MSVKEEILRRVRSVERNADNFGVLSMGEACAVALLLNRLDLFASGGYRHPLDALERLGPEWERAVREIHREGWRR
jgi:hypothetical protein